MRVDPELRRAFNFFRAQVGGIVGERARAALTLARAERDARIAGLVIVWEYDYDTDWSFVQTWDRAEQERWNRDVHIAEWCRVDQPCTCCGNLRGTLASMGGIIDADANYRRVIEAELALEALERVEVSV